MSIEDDPAAAARVEEILAKVDQEVARRQASEAAAEPATSHAPAAPAPAASDASATPVEEAPVAQAAREVAAAATDPARAISLAVGPDGTATPPRPMTPADLASGVAAARRRLAIVTTQLDELAARVTALAELTPGGAAALSGGPLAAAAAATPPGAEPAPVPPPDLMASGLIAPIPTETAPDVGAPSLGSPAASPPRVVGSAALRAPVAPDSGPGSATLGGPVAPERGTGAGALGAPQSSTDPAEPSPSGEVVRELGGRGSAAGMSIRPRPPAQHDRRVSGADRARLVAVELAVAGRPRGDVDRILRIDHEVGDPTAMLDSLYGAGTGPDARMPGSG